VKSTSSQFDRRRRPHTNCVAGAELKIGELRGQAYPAARVNQRPAL